MLKNDQLLLTLHFRDFEISTRFPSFFFEIASCFSSVRELKFDLRDQYYGNQNIRVRQIAEQDFFSVLKLPTHSCSILRVTLTKIPRADSNNIRCLIY